MGISKKKGDNQHGLMALAGETAKMASNMIVLNKTEAALDKEIERETSYRPTTKFGKARRKGEHILRSKYLLLAVVVLNIVDCLLVLGELMLDIKYVTDLLKRELDQNEKFVEQMKGIYPSELSYIGPSDLSSLEDKLLSATIYWKTIIDDLSTRQSENDTYPCFGNEQLKRANKEKTSDIAKTVNGSEIEAERWSRGGHHEQIHGHSLEEEIAHALHKASISILGILVVECFDIVIVLASFAVDLAFLKGLQQFTVQDFVLILSFMVPWRIIRVVNSLVVAIMDHEHFRLILLYKQKKRVVQELQEYKEETKGLQACIDALSKMCQDAGVPDKYVKAKQNMYRKMKAKSGNAIGAISSYAMGGDVMLKPFANSGQSETPSNSVVIAIETVGPQSVENAEVKDSNSFVDTGQTEMLNRPIPNLTVRRRQTSNAPSDRQTDHLLKDSMESKNKFNNITVSINPLSSTTNEPIQGKFGRLDSRPRSRSAVEPGDGNSPVYRRLAETSATFITTMNKDGPAVRPASSHPNDDCPSEDAAKLEGMTDTTTTVQQPTEESPDISKIENQVKSGDDGAWQ